MRSIIGPEARGNQLDDLTVKQLNRLAKIMIKSKIKIHR